MSQTRSWIQIDPKSHFSLNNLPFGIISTKTEPEHRPAVAIGDFALDLHAFSKGNGFVQFRVSSREHLILAFSSPTLNAFAALGRPVHREVRSYLQSIFRVDTPHPELLQDNKSLRAEALIPLSQIQSHLPLSIGDYTDFFAGRNHAFNIGTLFRGPQNALQPNYTHLPVAYHGRASSVVVSGTPIHRPWGQILLDPKAEPKVPTFMPCKRLDIELELGMFVCKGNDFGRPIPIHRAEEYIFGYVLMNDWSARDIQLWEYVPLGPFNAKNFGTTISPWVVLADALEPFRVKGLENGTDLQEYLKDNREDTALSIELQVDLKTSNSNTTTITRTNSRNVIWSWSQMIAHHSISGCNLRSGDLFGSGTISGSESGSQGSILEQTEGGKRPLKLSGGEERKFLENEDTVTIRGWTGEDGALIGFGECAGKIEASIPFQDMINGEAHA